MVLDEDDEHVAWIEHAREDRLISGILRGVVRRYDLVVWVTDRCQKTQGRGRKKRGKIRDGEMVERERGGGVGGEGEKDTLALSRSPCHWRQHSQ